VVLRAAMAEAAGRDAIARQYATGFADIFAIGLPAYEGALARGAARAWAVTETYLAWLAALPDSHLARRHGPAAAALVQRAGARWLARLRAAPAPARLASPLLAWDARLKRQGRNPGTSADLTVATLFAHALRGLPRPRGDG
jgi:triphosphoribosyl-dephospho-CoA synthase